MHLNFLVTGAGAPGIRGTLYSLKHSSFWESCSVVGVDINPNAVGRYFLESFYQVSPVSDPNYNQQILEIVNREKIDLIVPQTTKEIAHFAKYKKWYKDRGVSVLVMTEQSIDIANNKAKLLSAFKKNDLYTPNYKLVRSCVELEETVRMMGYPEKKVVIKIPVSNGSRGVRILSEQKLNIDRFLNEKPEAMSMNLQDALLMFSDADIFPELLVMEYLPGDEWSVDVFRGSDGNICIVPRVRNIIRSGIAFKTTVEKNDAIIGFVKKIADRLDMTTVFGFQFKMNKDGVPGLLESNPRIQGTMVASTFAGANLIAMACADVLKISYTLPLSSEINWGVCFDRIWGGVGIDNGICINEI